MRPPALPILSGEAETRGLFIRGSRLLVRAKESPHGPLRLWESSIANRLLQALAGSITAAAVFELSPAAAGARTVTGGRQTEISPSAESAVAIGFVPLVTRFAQHLGDEVLPPSIARKVERPKLEDGSLAGAAS